MLIDLNAERNARAAKREGGAATVTVPFGADTFQLPAELPAAVLEHLLDPEVEIAQLLIVALRAYKEGSERSGEIIADVLASQPDLPMGFVRAVMAAIGDLFGDEQWARFQALGPSLQDIVALIKGLFKCYGVSLGEAFSSSARSESAGATSKPTSNASTTSTPAELSPPAAPLNSLASAG